MSFFGVLITALLLSLGAPFWYGALGKLLQLRSVLAVKDDAQRLDRQLNEPPPKPPAGGPGTRALQADRRSGLGSWKLGVGSCRDAPHALGYHPLSAMRAVTRHVAPLLALLATCSAASAGVGQGQAAQEPQQQPPPRIRVSVDVVAVDVQVIDSTGRPVPNLGPEKFSVTINGRRRRVVSAEQIGSEAPGLPGKAAPAPATLASSCARARHHDRRRLHQFRHGCGA